MPTKYNASKSAKEADRYKLREYPFMLMTDPQEIENYIDTNIHTIPDMREMLKILAKVVFLHRSLE